MNILVGNHHLVKTGGTENYTYTLAKELKRQGHNVEYFTLNKGDVSDLLEQEGIPFMSKAYYDLILANHTSVIESVYKRGYVIQTCHGTIPELEKPSKYADKYVSITEEVQNHLAKSGIDSIVIPNGIDCNRFFPKTKLSSTLTTVLSLCQSKEANDFIESCCNEIGLKFLSCNKYTDNVWTLEDSINKADLVVGIGRSLYDAMACGRCVVSFDYRDYIGKPLGDGFISKENISECIKNNCTGRSLKRNFSHSEFIEELRKYSIENGAWARQYALEFLNIEKIVQSYLSLVTEAEKSNKILKSLELYASAESEKDKQLLELCKVKEENTTNKQYIISLNNRISQLEESKERAEKKNQKHLKQLRYLLVLLILLISLIVIYISSNSAIFNQ